MALGSAVAHDGMEHGAVKHRMLVVVAVGKQSLRTVLLNGAYKALDRITHWENIALGLVTTEQNAVRKITGHYPADR